MASRIVTAPVVSGVGDGEGGASAQPLAPGGNALWTCTRTRRYCMSTGAASCHTGSDVVGRQ